MKMRYLRWQTVQTALAREHFQIASGSGMLKGKVNIKVDVKYGSLQREAPPAVTFMANASCRQHSGSREADGE